MNTGNISLGICQIDLAWKDRKKNLDHAEQQLSRFENPPDVILLPETFTTGFCMKPEDIAEVANGESVNWMSAQAQRLDALIMGSIITNDKGDIYNRLICAFPDGKTQYYNKRHLFTYAGEDHHFTPGKGKLIVNFRGWRIMPLICYDLRFPVWSRSDDNYDLLVYVANWPKPRIKAWDSLLAARAIENLAYVAGANRVGVDGNDIEYIGSSGVYDFMGNCMHNAGSEEAVFSVSLSMADLKEFRSKYNFLADRDRFSIAPS